MSLHSEVQLYFCLWIFDLLLSICSGYGEVDWTNLNPQKAIDKLSQFSPSMANSIREVMDKVGSDFYLLSWLSSFWNLWQWPTGWNFNWLPREALSGSSWSSLPRDCPKLFIKRGTWRSLSAIKKSQISGCCFTKTFQPPDVASVLAQGCDGFAKNYMHFSEDMMLGGIQRNKSGHLVRSVLAYIVARHFERRICFLNFVLSDDDDDQEDDGDGGDEDDEEEECYHDYRLCGVVFRLLFAWKVCSLSDHPDLIFIQRLLAPLSTPRLILS